MINLQRRYSSLFLLLIVFSGFLAQFEIYGVNSEQNEIKVVASMEIYSSIAEYIGGGLIKASYILPEGSDPHDYALTPGDINKISEADLLILANSKFFTLEENMLQHYSGPVLDFEDYSRYNLTLIEIPSVGLNYHGYWILPDNALAIAKAIHDELVLLDPSHKDIYDSNLERFTDSIYRIKSLIYRTAIDSGIYGSGAVIAVPGVAYLALSFGLRIEATLLVGPGGFLNSSELDQVIEKADKGEIKVILCPAALKNGKPGEFSRQLSKDTGLPVIYVRVFSISGLKDYFALMTYNAGVLSTFKEIGASSSGENLLVWYIISAGILFIVVIVESIVIFIYKRRSEYAWFEE